MRKLVTVLVLVVGFAFTSCSKDTCDVDEMISSIDGQTGSLSLSSLGVNVKEKGFGTSNSSGRSIGEAEYDGTLTVTVGNSSRVISLTGTATDVLLAIEDAPAFTELPYGTQTVTFAIAGVGGLSYSRLSLDSPASVNVEIGSTPKVITVELSPADAYIDVELISGSNIGTMTTDTPDGYYAPQPGKIITAQAVDAAGTVYNASVTLDVVAAKAYTVNFNASVDLSGSVSFSALVNGFTPADAIETSDFVSAAPDYAAQGLTGTQGTTDSRINLDQTDHGLVNSFSISYNVYVNGVQIVLGDEPLVLRYRSDGGTDFPNTLEKVGGNLNAFTTFDYSNAFDLVVQ